MPIPLAYFFLTLVLYCLVSNVGGSQKTLESLDEAPVIHATLIRRGGTFEATRPGNDSLDMDSLLQQLETVEAKFNLTRREVKGNKLVRKAKSRALGGKADDGLMGELALNGTWFARISIGKPPQTIDLDLNMLTSDFYVSHTTSHLGTSMLGLAPSKHLRQIETPFYLHQLLEKGIVERPVFSLMLISGYEGVLTIGGTAVQAAHMADKQTAEELDRAGAQEKIDAFTKENGETLENSVISLGQAKPSEEKIILQKRAVDVKDFRATEANWEDGWTWTKVQGAEGWWQTLMQGVWVGGRRVLQNQAVVIDVRMEPTTMGLYRLTMA
ncbi:MAG: hypothetical protein Q9219_006143 [cf. Caloplaca sp. 3 TL-2023]